MRAEVVLVQTHDRIRDDARDVAGVVAIRESFEDEADLVHAGGPVVRWSDGPAEERSSLPDDRIPGLPDLRVQKFGPP